MPKIEAVFSPCSLRARQIRRAGPVRLGVRRGDLSTMNNKQNPWAAAAAIRASDPQSLTGQHVFIRGYGKGVITEFHQMVPGWPSKHTVQFVSGEVDKIVLWNGKNGGAWFRITGPDEQGAANKPHDQQSSQKRVSSPFSSTGAFQSGQLTIHIEEAHGCQTDDESYFATNPVSCFCYLPYFESHVNHAGHLRDCVSGPRCNNFSYRHRIYCRDNNYLERCSRINTENRFEQLQGVVAGNVEQQLCE